MRVGEICVTERLKPTDVAGCKLRLADFCTLTEALDYAAISRAGAEDLPRIGVAVTQRALLANVRGISRDALELNSDDLGLTYAGPLLPAWRRGIAA